MRGLFVIVALIGSVGARAEQYFECRQSAQSDSMSVFGAPKKVNLDEAGRWYLREDGRSVKGFRVKAVGHSVQVSYTKSDGANLLEARYVFNGRRCDSHGEGSAVLNRQRIGAADSFGPQASTTIYRCTCGVD